MALTNSERQARYRARLKLAASDRGFLTRLFGAEIPPEADDMFEVAKAVECSDKGAIKHAISALVADVVHRGVGGGFVGGWSWREADGRVAISVCRVRSQSAKAA